ncbi:T9SS type A sorting domain-containing protein [bacterium]|nr:T9SS type A sorting domain-containing protein [bacterium]
MKALLMVLGCGLLISVVLAQPDTLWTRVYGGLEFDRSLGALPLQDGGFFVTGYTESFGAGFRDMWLLRLDENGDTLWTRTYGGSEEDVGNSIIPAQDGNYWLSGRTMSYGVGARDWLLIKIDENGDSLWSRTFGSAGADWGGRIEPTSDGGMIMTGQWSSDSLGAQMGIIKLNADGNSLWGKYFGGPGHEVCTDAFETEDGGYILAGTTESYAIGERDYWLLKLNANGDSLWSHSYGGEFMENCNAVQPTDDGGYMLGGTTWSYGAGAADMWIVKTNATGDSLWSRTYGGAADDDCRDICKTRDGGFVLAGFSREFNGGESVLIRVDANGDSLWSLRNGSLEDDDRNYWIETLSDGSYFTGGLRLNHPEENDDFWLIRTGPDPVRHAPGEFERVSPVDSSYAGETQQYVELIWTRSIDLDGDIIHYLLHLDSPTFDFVPMPIDTVLSDTAFTFEAPFIDLPHQSLDEIHEFHWSVFATDGFDTVEASNGAGYFLLDRTGDIDNSFIELPAEFSLSVYPNPFNPSTTIEFSLPQAGFVRLALFDITGREIRTLLNERRSAGSYNLKIDCADLPSGILFARLNGETQTVTQKLMLIK